jgi:transposase
VAVVHDPELRKQYLHRCHQKPKAVAKVAVARKLAVQYWMLRTQKAYPEIVRIESSPGLPLVGAS